MPCVSLVAYGGGERVCVLLLLGFSRSEQVKKGGKRKKRNGSFGVSLNGMGRIFHGRDERIF